ncbi:MAG: hypothetical protein AUI15_41680 [Actinobacteria bacterium 13_2_20CM_2_66_6]|nr:MAG: hypothetical protein AUI15_41680 [Actinobacteria bacterium 13_2_20CM_2_66_6]
MSGASTRRALATILAVAFLASCTESGQPSKNGPFNDVEGAPKLARDAGALLLQVSAYDYGLAGALAGDQRRTVAAARYGAVMRGTTQSIGAFNAAVLAGTLDRTGPIREKLVPLADGLSDLARDGETYADGGDPAAFARVLSDVTAGWQRLRDLSTTLPKDDALQNTIARGLSFVVTSKSSTQSTIRTRRHGGRGPAEAGRHQRRDRRPVLRIRSKRTAPRCRAVARALASARGPGHLSKDRPELGWLLGCDGQ